MIKFKITYLMLLAFFSVNTAYAADKKLCDTAIEGVSIKNTYEEVKKIWEEQGFVKDKEIVTPPLGGFTAEGIELVYNNFTPKTWREGGGLELRWFGGREGHGNSVKVTYLALHQKAWNETRYYGRGQELISKYCKDKGHNCNLNEDFVNKMGPDKYIKPGSDTCIIIFRSNGRDHMETISYVH